MRLLSFPLLLIFFCCCERANHKPFTGTAITGCDGITVIKAVQLKLSDTVIVDITMRPEMRKSIYVLWSSIDSNKQRRMHKSKVNDGAWVSTIIEVSPGAKITDIRITGYERIRS
jgi:hypothetical protein